MTKNSNLLVGINYVQNADQRTERKNFVVVVQLFKNHQIIVFLVQLPAPIILRGEAEKLTIRQDM